MRDKKLKTIIRNYDFNNYLNSKFAKLEKEWNETGIKPINYDKVKENFQKSNIIELKNLKN